MGKYWEYGNIIGNHLNINGTYIYILVKYHGEIIFQIMAIHSSSHEHLTWLVNSQPCWLMIGFCWVLLSMNHGIHGGLSRSNISKIIINRWIHGSLIDLLIDNPWIINGFTIIGNPYGNPMKHNLPSVSTWISTHGWLVGWAVDDETLMDQLAVNDGHIWWRESPLAAHCAGIFAYTNGCFLGLFPATFHTLMFWIIIDDGYCSNFHPIIVLELMFWL